MDENQEYPVEVTQESKEPDVSAAEAEAKAEQERMQWLAGRPRRFEQYNDAHMLREGWLCHEPLETRPYADKLLVLTDNSCSDFVLVSSNQLAWYYEERCNGVRRVMPLLPGMAAGGVNLDHLRWYKELEVCPGR